MSLRSATLALLAGAAAQQPGTLSPTEVHPSLTVQECTTSGGCTTQERSIVLDANWRWVDVDAKNCYDGSKWTEICDGKPNCTATCELEGAAYEATYGITTSGSDLTLKFVTSGTSGDNVGSRTYLMAADDTNYEMFHLANREFTFDVDVSTLPCGLNAALYFVEMAEDGGLAAEGNNAGAAFGTGYCDAQCPHDIKFIEGEANSLDWIPKTASSGIGRYGACCTELDIWEANTVSNAFTPHPCDNEGLLRCEGVECGDTASGERYAGTCDKDGCDYASFRLGEHEFYGEGAGFALDSSRPFTVVTQFITDDGTDDGTLVEMRRKYVQDGNVIENPAVAVGGATYDSVSDGFCAAQKTAFGDENAFAAKGGMAATGASMSRGHVLVMSLWDDYDVSMLWLDSLYPTDANETTPGAYRGTCPTTSGDPAEVEAANPDAYVTYSNIRTGELDSTYGGGAVTADDAPAPATDDGSDACAAAYAQCGGKSWSGATCCVDGYACTASGGDYYSQCTPEAARLAQVA